MFAAFIGQPSLEILFPGTYTDGLPGMYMPCASETEFVLLYLPYMLFLILNH